MNACATCQGILDADAGRHPWAVAQLGAGYVWLNQCQYYPGATFYVAPWCVTELHELADDERRDHLMDMAAVGAAVHDEFGAHKMNYEALVLDDLRFLNVSDGVAVIGTRCRGPPA